MAAVNLEVILCGVVLNVSLGSTLDERSLKIHYEFWKTIPFSTF